MFRNYSHLKYSILLFLTISIGGSGCLFSQSRYTALIPDVDVAIPHQSSNHLRVQADSVGDETVKSFFKFSFKNLPLATDIDTYILKLYNLDNPNTTQYSSHAIKVLEGTNTWTGKETSLNDSKLNWSVYNNSTNKYIGSRVIKEKTTELLMKLNPEAFTSISDNTASLAILSAQNRYTDFYSFATAKQSNYFSKIPKLLLEYEITQSPFRMDWAQSFSNATHTSALNWKTNTTVTEAKANTLPNPAADVMVGADPSGAIAIYQNQPIVFTQAATGNDAFSIKQLDARGKILWSTPVDNMAKSWPVIDEKGRLYYFSSSNTLTVIDLADSGKIIHHAKSLSDLTGNEISAIDYNVTIGYDGTLYLSSATDGIVALSAYPQLKLRWKFPQNSSERNGPISLSLDESKAFFINVNTTQRTSRLIVLDNMDASVLDTSKYVLGGYQNDNNYYIPAPIVHKNEAVFVLNGYDVSNKLFVFDIDKGGDISLKNTIDAVNGSINTGISQPVIDYEDHVFFVYNKKLALYDTKKNEVTTFDGSDSLDNASILITDYSSNIYASDPYSTTKKVLGFSYSNKAFKNEFSLPINTNTKKNLALAPDGTLYTVTANNVISITPQTVSQEDITISKEDLNTNTVYRATNKITVEGFDVLSTINTILYSGGGMSFKPGFSVKKGAQITCKTGY
jgi:hypothetical protein